MIPETKHHFDFQSQEAIRLDKYLADQFTYLSRAKIQKLIKDGQITIDDIVVEKSSFKLEQGMQLEILVPEETDAPLIPQKIELDIIFENEHVIVINKPCGMVVHPGAGNVSNTLMNALINYHPAIVNVGGEGRPGIVHRLDKDTSGVIIAAKTQSAYLALTSQFKLRKTEKIYIALVDNHPPTSKGRIEAPLERDPIHRQRMKVALDGSGRRAVTEFYETQRFEKHSLLEVHPFTGRTHQIRVHMAFIGCPITGDRVYGKHSPSLPLKSFLLHAQRLSIQLPGEKQVTQFEAPLPDKFQDILTRLTQ